MGLEEKSPQLAQTFLKFDHSAPQFLTFQNVEYKGHGGCKGGCPACIWSVGQACLLEFRFQPLWLCVWFSSYLIGYRNGYWPKDSSCKVHSTLPACKWVWCLQNIQAKPNIYHSGFLKVPMTRGYIFWKAYASRNNVRCRKERFFLLEISVPSHLVTFPHFLFLSI